VQTSLSRIVDMTLRLEDHSRLRQSAAHRDQQSRVRRTLGNLSSSRGQSHHEGPRVGRPGDHINDLVSADADGGAGRSEMPMVWLVGGVSTSVEGSAKNERKISCPHSVHRAPWPIPGSSTIVACSPSLVAVSFFPAFRTVRTWARE
jgi:hypothetical protein